MATSIRRDGSIQILNDHYPNIITMCKLATIEKKNFPYVDKWLGNDNIVHA